MTKNRKERTIKDLYDATQQILEAEVTPVLKGNCRIQGPMDDTNCGNTTEKETSSSQPEKRFSRRSAAEKATLKAESGTCNVCAAPCSLCGHFNQTVSCMEMKAENEFSDEASRVNSATRCSFNDNGVMPSIKKRARSGRHPAGSETSNLLSASSSRDSISENAESKVSLRTFDAKVDVEMLPKVTVVGAVAHDQILSRPQPVMGQSVNKLSNYDATFDAGQRTIENKYEVQNSCNGDELSCVIGDNDAHTPLRDLNADVDRKNVSGSTTSVSSFSPEGFEKMCHVQSDPDRLAGSHYERKDSHIKEDVPKPENGKSDIINSYSYGTSMKNNGCLESGIIVDTAQPPTKSGEQLDTNEQTEKSSVLPKVSNNEDPSESQSMDVSDGSDIVEDDVKVCDICGDAGREDLLAICSRCSDGAEHTYCMRIMMDKVPEGDWLCEVCQLKEEALNKRKDKCETVSESPRVSSVNEKSDKSVGVLDSKISPKSDTQIPDEEANRATKVAPSPRLLSKRQSDNLEVSSASKRQALESSTGSPKPSSPSKTNVLSREMSFKNLDNGKGKSVHPIPSAGGSSYQDTARPPTLSVQNSSKIHPRLQSPRGTLLKSNSFNTSNLKSKVKMVQEEVLQKNKLGKHSSTSGSRKEGPVRTISKSSSFNIGSSHSIFDEFKAKVHSSNLSRAEDSRVIKLGKEREDLRGIKIGKERNIIERKNSVKSDCLVSPTAGSNASSQKDEQRVSSRGGPVPLPSTTTKFRDMKAIQADVKLRTSSKSTSPLPHRGSETPNALAGRGDFKRQSSSVSRGGGYPSFNANSAEQKQSQVNLKDDTLANLSSSADRSSSNPDVISRDGIPNQDKKGEEPCFSQPRLSVPAAGKSIRCNKCKEIGHAAQFCPNGSLSVSVLEATATGNSREVLNRSTKKSRLPDQSDELSMSSTELSCEIDPKDQLSNPLNCLGNFTPSDGAYDRQESFKNSTVESRSTAVTDVKHNAFHPREGEVFTHKAVDLNAIVISSDGNQLRPSLCDFQDQGSSIFIPPRVSSIPEQEYIWQGGFNVQKSGRLLDSFNGLQAHLSTCVSLKVLEVANKLPDNVLLEEVSRSSTWPTQFQNGATEDNIALYFFAKDVESYIRNYQSLVENMMKNDLALKGILDGIELLIFPSNQLCEKYKRWNMLYFLWGVFRSKRVNISEKMDGSMQNLSAANLNVVPLEEELPSPVIAVTRNDSSSGNTDECLPTLGKSLSGQETVDSTALMKFPSSSSSQRVGRKNYKEESSSGLRCSGLETKSSLGDIDLDSNCSLMIPASSVQLCTDINGNGTSKLVRGYLKNKEETELGQCIQEERENICLTKGKSVILDNKIGRQAVFPSPSPQRQEACSGLFKLYPEDASLISQFGCAVGSRMEVIVEERMNSDEVRHREILKDEEGMLDADFVLENDPLGSDLVNEHGTWGVKSSRKRPYSAVAKMAPQASVESSACTSQLVPWEGKEDVLDDGEIECKKMKRVYSETSSSDTYRCHNSLTSQMLDQRSNFSIKDQRIDGTYDGTIVPGNSTTAERFFFPVEVGPIKDLGVIDNSVAVQVISSDDEDLLESEHPNLDLALGGEKKSPKQRMGSMVDHFSKKKNDRGKCPEILTDNGEDDSLDSLSLSLAVPFSNKMVQTPKPVSKPEPEKNSIDTSLFLFGGFSGT